MKILVSVVSLDEAKIAIKGNPHILDIKNPDEGSLGAQFPWVIREIVNESRKSNINCSATLGDLPFKPGTAALAAYGVASCEVDYIKAGLFGSKNYKEALQMIDGIVRGVKSISKDILVAAAGYADYKRFDGLHYMELARAANSAGADVIMVDTAIKDGQTIFDAMDLNQLKEFIDYGHNHGLKVAIAGSIKKDHLEDIKELKPDIIGIRGDICYNGNRLKGIDSLKVEEFVHIVNSLNLEMSIT